MLISKFIFGQHIHVLITFALRQQKTSYFGIKIIQYKQYEKLDNYVIFLIGNRLLLILIFMKWHSHNFKMIQIVHKAIFRRNHILCHFISRYLKCDANIDLTLVFDFASILILIKISIYYTDKHKCC